MAGHSKWAQIKRQKGAADAVKSKLFSRYARLIALESKKAGGVQSSPALAATIARAKAANMPKENIERAIANGISKTAGELDRIAYEAYGPGGAAIVIDALTDNKNRTAQELKHLLSTQGIELAAPGSALWAFSKREGAYEPNEPLVELSEEDGARLGALLDALTERDDVQQAFTNARGYENTGD